MSDTEEISKQLVLLNSHRDTLFFCLRRLAKVGEAHADPGLLHDIKDARAHIRRIKDTLRQMGVSVSNAPDDADPNEIAQPETTSAKGALRDSPTVVITEQVSSPQPDGPAPEHTDRHSHSRLYLTYKVQTDNNTTIDLYVHVSESTEQNRIPFDLPILDDLPTQIDTMSQWLEDVLKRLISKELLSAQAPPAQQIRALGLYLFDALFPKGYSEAGYQLYQQLDQQAKTSDTESKQKTLRIWLDLPTTLAHIPWELSWDANHAHIATNMSNAFIRTLSDCAPLLNAQPMLRKPLRINTILAAPQHDPLIRPIQAELNQHQQRFIELHNTLLQGSDDVQIEYIEQPGTYQQLARRLQQATPIDILHFFCHCQLVGDEAYLQFVRVIKGATESDADPISVLQLRTLIQERLRTHPEQRLPIIILNTCFGGSAAPQGVLRSLAAELIKQGVPAVVAMQGKVAPEIVNQLTEALYDQLWAAKTIDQALTSARNKLYNDYASTLEWATPILFLHPQAVRIRVCSAALFRDISEASIITRYTFLEAHGLGTINNNEQFFSTSADILNEDRFQRTFVPLSLRSLINQRIYSKKIMDELCKPRSSFLFAPIGHGTSSYQRKITSNTKSDDGGQLLVIPFDFIREVGIDKNKEVGIYEHVRHIKRKTHDLLYECFANEKHRMDTLQQDSNAYRLFNELSQDTKGVRYHSDRYHQPYWLANLTRIVRASSYSGIFVIFDGLHQPDIDINIIFKVIKPLMLNNYLTIPNLIFKFFLPDRVTNQISNYFALTPDYFHAYQIEAWRDNELRDLMTAIFQYYHSIGKLDPQEPIGQFGDLCDACPDVDERLLKAAAGSPRRLILKMREIIDAHCEQATSADSLISRTTIDTILPPLEKTV